MGGAHAGAPWGSGSIPGPLSPSAPRVRRCWSTGTGRYRGHGGDAGRGVGGLRPPTAPPAPRGRLWRRNPAGGMGGVMPWRGGGKKSCGRGTATAGAVPVGCGRRGSGSRIPAHAWAGLRRPRGAPLPRYRAAGHRSTAGCGQGPFPVPAGGCPAAGARTGRHGDGRGGGQAGAGTAGTPRRPRVMRSAAVAAARPFPAERRGPVWGCPAGIPGAPVGAAGDVRPGSA